MTTKDRCNSFKARIKLFTIIVILLISSVTVTAKADDNTQRRKVKVGCSLSTGYYEKNEDGQITGYGYSYDQIMAQYAGWDIEYVNGSWTKLQQMLADGDIDMLGFLIKNNERENIYSFADSKAGSSMSCLVTRKDDKRYTFQDYEAFNKITIACQKSNANIIEYEKYAKENGFSFNVKYYDTYSEVYSAIDKKDVDAGLMTNFQDLSNYNVVDQFLAIDFYYAVKKSNDELLTEINDAQIKIDTYYTDLSGDLYKKYYELNNGRDTMFTKEEIEYLKSNPKITVIPGGRERPFEYFDKEKGCYVGIVPDVLEKVSQITGIEFDYYQTDDRWAAENDDIEGNIITSITCDIGWENKKDLLMTQPFVESSISVVSKNGSSDVKKIAILHDRYINEVAAKEKPNCELIYYDTNVECLDAVKSGKCDCTVMNSYEADYFLSMGRYQSLKEESIHGIIQNIGFGVVKQSDMYIYSIMSKALLMIPSQEYDDIVRGYVTSAADNSFIDEIYAHPAQFILGISMIVALILIIFFFIIYVNNMKKKNKEIVFANQAKTDFLSRMSHDIRTPMNTIVNLTRLVKDEIDDKEAALEDLGKIETSNQFLLALVNDVLDMSKIEDKSIELHPEIYSYKEFLDYMYSTFEPLAQEKNITLIIEKGDRDVDIIMDKVRFNQLCFNLLSNAIKYTKPDGTVEFKMVHGDIIDNHLPCDIYVIDNGIGMSEEFQTKMFEPFSQEGRAYKTVEGTGLGLPIVKEIVELLGGKMDVSSKEGEGTTFHIHIMMEIAKGKKIQESENIFDIDILNGVHVLLAEDHPLNQEIARKLLNKAGMIVKIVNNGKEAVEDFKENYREYDIILMDIRMPIMDGFEATKAIRECKDINKALTIPIIAMTANAYDEDVKKCIECGMNAHLSKPVNPKMMYKTIGKEIKNV